MAGLSRLSGTGRGRLPMFPAGDKSSVTPYYNYDNNESAYVHLPAFTGAANSSSIRILQNSTSSFNATLYNIEGSAASNGVWNSGMTIAEGAGSSNADRFIGCYMDETDNLFYMLFTDTSVSPNVWYFSKVNAAGTVTAIGNAAIGNGNFNGMWYGADATGPLYRVGGDGSGDFAITAMGVIGGNSNAGVPYRGTTITISASDGSHSFSSGVMPSAYGAGTYLLSPTFGPTANGIIGGAVVTATYTQSPPLASGYYGAIGNTTTGRFATRVFFGNPETNGYPGGLSSFIVYRGRSKYIFSVYSNSFNGSPAVYDEEETHTWLDKMAVYYGIL